MADLERAQAVVEGCKHPFINMKRVKHVITGYACAPCIQAYAEAVRKETVERCAKIAGVRGACSSAHLDTHPDPCTVCKEVEMACDDIATTLRTTAGETG